MTTALCACAVDAPLVGRREPPRVQVTATPAEYSQDNKDPSQTRKDNVPKKEKPRRKKDTPDEGWGWVIVLCSLVISLIQDGVSFSFGLIYVELLREFDESKSKTAWVGAFFLSVPLLAGPIASALVERFGCCAMTITGGLLSAAGFVASAVWGRSIEVLFFTFGLVSGLGLALGYVTAVVSIAYWFDKKRSLANGLGVCGTGIGTFLFAPITQLCLDEYGWRGTTLLLGGAFLQMCICGCAMREPEWIKNKNKCDKISRKSNEDVTFKWSLTECENINNSDNESKVEDSEPALTTVVLNHRAVSLSPPPPNSYRLTQHRHSLTYRGALVRVSTPWMSVEDRAASCPDLLVSTTVTAKPAPWWHRYSMLRLLVTSLDFSLFCDPPFFLLNAGTFLLFTWFIVPYFYLAEHMLRHGYTDTDASFLIAIIGVPNTIAMVALGWAGDKPWLPVSNTYAVCLIICGLSTLAMPLLIDSFVGLAMAAGLFGLTFAANFSFTPVLLVQLVPLDRFTIAYGLVLLVQGLGNLLGPPLAGMVFDMTGSWDLSFYMAGLGIVISGFLTLLIPVYDTRRNSPATDEAPNVRL